ncbi:hypothetical protein KSF73_12275 [Burkholderiaceae bacterium DAT-1]|nr:hypothetical protein [Burkholderiaceae bacterium DAT-1]
MSLSPIVYDLIRSTTGCLLLAAAGGKLATLTQFRHHLHESFHIPRYFTGYVASMLVAVESMLACACIGINTSIAVPACLALFVVLTTLLIWRYLTSSLVRCSCFGESGRPLSHWDIGRNLLIIGLLVCATLLQAQGQPPLHPHLLSLALSFPLALLLIHLHDVATIVQQYIQEAHV